MCEETSHKSDEISAQVDAELAKTIIEEYYGLRGQGISKLDGYDDLNFHLLQPVSHISNHSSAVILWPHGYILKIFNSRDSENVAFIKEYIKVLLHLNSKNVSCPLPIKNIKGDYFCSWIDPRKKENARKHVIIMLTYQPGEELQAFKCDERIAFSLGQVMSKLHLHLEPFRYSKVFHRPEFPWGLEAVPMIRRFLNEICIPEEKRNCVQSVIDEFESDILLKLNDLEKGVIHNDLNDRNLLVKRIDGEDDRIEFTGIIDFADMVYTAYLFDIAITTCYLCLNNPEEPPIKLISALLVGYQRRHLTDTEYRLLKICICARLSQSLMMGLLAYSINPSNSYVLETQKDGWKLLDLYHNMDNEHFVKELQREMETYVNKYQDVQQG